MSARIPKLPACERCRLRKIGCDTQPPKCAACVRSNRACIIVDPVTKERYSRDGIHQLEQRLDQLEANAKAESDSAIIVSSPESVRQSQEKTHYVGDGSGLGFFRRLSSNANAVLQRTDNLPEAVPRSPFVFGAIPAHSLPPWEVARMLADRYFSHIHLHHPLLARRTVSDMLQRVYNHGSVESSPEDLYRTHMIFAISSVTLFRQGHIQEHPYGYFRAAQQYGPQVSLLGSIEAVQNLLLIARFAMYYHIDCSIWDIARLCMMQCTELGLHRPPVQKLPPFDEQAQRNLFWDCYIHDRYSSGILGRPYAIEEQDIEVAPPIEASEEDVVSSSAPSLDHIDLEYVTRPNEASVFLFVLRLRRITTRISTCFFSSQNHATHSRRTITEAGSVKMNLDRFLTELRCAHDNAPVFPEPSSLYQRSEWYDFLVEKDRLYLIRGALSQIPIDGLQPPRALLRMCLNCAIRVIELYSYMFEHEFITWTRSYFQLLFTSGLSIMYSLSTLKKIKGNEQRPYEGPELLHAAKALVSAKNLLQRFVSDMPDASRFALVFEVLIVQYVGSVPHSNQSDPPSSPMAHSSNPGQPDSSNAVNSTIWQTTRPSTFSPGVIDQSTIQTQRAAAAGNNQNYFPFAGEDLSPFPSNIRQIFHPNTSISIPTTTNNSKNNPNGYSREINDNNAYNGNFAFSLGPELGTGLEDFQNWNLFPTNFDSNFLLQMEAGLGENTIG